MHNTFRSRATTFTLIALGLAIGAMGLYVGEVDDAPGAGGIGLLLMGAGVGLGVREARRGLPTWAARTAIAVGVAVAVFAALITRGVAASVPLFRQPADIPSLVSGAPPASWASAVGRARDLARTAVLEQNLPGVSVAVAAGGALVWAEGFGWRDVATRTPMTPATRFNIGTAAAVMAPVTARLGLADTGMDAATAWSPEHVGEPEEDFPPFTMVRHAVLQPLGLVAPEYPLPGERATFYVPSAASNDPRRGRRLMSMRDLACCAGGMTFYSTPSDLVRAALAANLGSADGTLAGGPVASVVTRPDRGLVVAVMSNVAHAKTSALASHVAEGFDPPRR